VSCLDVLIDRRTSFLESGHFFARPQGEPRKRLHQPYRFRVRLHEHQRGRTGLNVIEDFDPEYLNADLMKPRRGFRLVAGKEELGGVRGIRGLTFGKLFSNFLKRPFIPG
jgi:hypothetical protein